MIRMLFQLKDRGLDLLSFCSIKIGDGSMNSFWHDVRKGMKLLLLLSIEFMVWILIDLLRSG